VLDGDDLAGDLVLPLDDGAVASLAKAAQLLVLLGAAGDDAPPLARCRFCDGGGGALHLAGGSRQKQDWDRGEWMGNDLAMR
jgi:hypothetical protein